MSDTAASLSELDCSGSIDHAYPTIDLARAGKSLQMLHDHVCGQNKRVEITRSGCEGRCVMVSKSELESMENAIEIFANTREFESMAQSIQQLLETAGVVYHPPAV